MSTFANSNIKIKPARRDKVRLNLMAVGATGTGKTTFLSSLLRRYVDNISVASPEVPLGEKTLNISKVGEFELKTETGDSVNVNLYDTPGFGDFVNNNDSIDDVKRFMIKNHNYWKTLHCQSMTEADVLMEDCRIHAVFYFISPHRFKEIDREFITQLSPFVPIIPIVSKADSMTVRERNLFMKEVHEKIIEITEKFGDSCIYDFQGDDLTSALQTTQGPFVRQPNLFAVVCDLSAERTYMYGKVKIENSQFSDFRRLQSVLFENVNHVKGLMDDTRLKTIKLFKPPSIPSKPPPPQFEVDVTALAPKFSVTTALAASDKPAETITALPSPDPHYSPLRKSPPDTQQSGSTMTSSPSTTKDKKGRKSSIMGIFSAAKN